MDVVGAVNDSNLILPAGTSRSAPAIITFIPTAWCRTSRIWTICPSRRGNQLGFARRRRRSQGCQPVAVQHRTHRRPEVRLYSHHEIGRGQQHHTGGERRSRPGKTSLRPSGAASTNIVFDQSVFVKQALNTVLHEGFIGLVLTSLMILLFLGSMRATGAVLLSIRSPPSPPSWSST